MRISTCNGRDCDAAIIFAPTAGGKVMPLDAEPNPDGNVECAVKGDQVSVIAVHPAGQDFLSTGTRYMPHWATCVNTKDFKK